IYYVNNVDTSLWTSSYNNLYNYEGSQPFAFLGGAISSFSDWVTATAATNLVSIDPYFNAAITGIRINNNLLNDMGTPISSITEDIEGNARDAQTPDIGAYEFDAAPWDIIAIEVVGPIGGCGLTTESVTVRYRNLGTSDISGSFNASYQFENATAVTEAVTATILAGDTLDYTFTTTIDMSVVTFGQDSVYVLRGWGSLANDLVQVNDTTSYVDIASGYVPADIYATNDTINYGQMATLYTVGNNPYWWASATDTVELWNDTSYTTPNLYDTTTYWVSDMNGAGGSFLLTETVQYKTGGGYTNPYPSYLPTGDWDGVEISNMGGSTASLSGYQIFVNSGANTYSYTFGANDEIEAQSVALALYGSGLTVGAAGNNVFNINSATSISSASVVSYWLLSPDGTVVDAFSANGAVFPASSGVTAADFTGSLLGGSGKAGSVRMIADNNDDTDWLLTSTTAASFGTFNSVLPVIAGQGCFSSNRTDVTVIVENIPSLDASIAAIVEPIGIISGNTNYVLKVDLKNYGTSDLTSLDIVYAIDNVVAGTYNWTGVLAYQTNDTVSIGTVSFDGGAYELSAWSTNPNSVPDTINTNDTAYANVVAALHGVYTIGDTTGGGNFDYPSFNAAVAALDEGGVDGSVIFNVETGIYTEQVIMPTIDGVSAVNTILFQSAELDSTKVTLRFASISYAVNYVLKLDATEYVTFQLMTIKSYGTGSYIGVIEVGGGSNYCSFKNNIIETPISTSSYARGIYSPNGNDKYMTITDNHFKNGYYA
ncbi:MAG: hypothetical protein KAH32_08495, partial [Chlamydiia bacterium]|nr:hypothetical protein [Chlamydiia bacterium]